MFVPQPASKAGGGEIGVFQYVHRNGDLSPDRIQHGIKRLLNNVELGQMHGQYTLAAPHKDDQRDGGRRSSGNIQQ